MRASECSRTVRWSNRGSTLVVLVLCWNTNTNGWLNCVDVVSVWVTRPQIFLLLQYFLEMCWPYNLHLSGSGDNNTCHTPLCAEKSSGLKSWMWLNGCPCTSSTLVNNYAIPLIFAVKRNGAWPSTKFISFFQSFFMVSLFSKLGDTTLLCVLVCRLSLH